MSSKIKSSRRGAKAPLLDSEIELSIEKLAVGGSGVARHDGMVFFVPDTAPGDRIRAKITTLKKNFGEAKIIELLQPGDSRRTPPCPVAGLCGGCNWQHLTEQEQCRQKELLVHETLLKFLPEQKFDYLPIKPSPRSLRYRNRIQPKFDAHRFGFYARNSHEIINIEDCPITEEDLTSQIPVAREWARGKRQSGRLEMYLDQQHQAHFIFTDDRDEGFGFSQVNRFQNDDLVATAIDWAQGKYRHIFDLYAGSGNFSFPLARSLKRPVIAVELSKKLVERGQSLTEDLDVKFIHSDVEKFLKKERLILSEDLVILDPPRAGCSEEVIKALVKAKPRKIIYISCHPVSLARDLKRFFEFSLLAYGSEMPLRLLRAQPFEMFPQTDHVETIVELGG